MKHRSDKKRCETDFEGLCAERCVTCRRPRSGDRSPGRSAGRWSSGAAAPRRRLSSRKRAKMTTLEPRPHGSKVISRRVTVPQGVHVCRCLHASLIIEVLFLDDVRAHSAGTQTHPRTRAESRCPSPRPQLGSLPCSIPRPAPPALSNNYIAGLLRL